jgi:hypothetical protein
MTLSLTLPRFTGKGARTPTRAALLRTVALLLLASPAPAHNVVDTPNLGKLITTAEVIVRGPITADTRAVKGALVATVKVDKVLKGEAPDKQIVFKSDPDHGVSYQRGERALIFLTKLPPGSEPRFLSPQIFRAKYTITSFDPTGYDALVTGLLRVSKVEDPSARDARLKELMTQQLHSHEYDVRAYAVQAIEELEAKPTAKHPY